MERRFNRLTARGAESLSAPGYHPDGGGLWLQVSGGGGKSWVLRYMIQGRAREMGLGSFRLVTLAKARIAAKEHQQRLLDGIDPIAARQTEKDEKRLATAKGITFAECAKAYIEAHKGGWRNVKHGEQWGNTLETYAYPTLGSLPVQSIDTSLVMKVLDPIWSTKTETASRIRGRIEAVLNWATVRKYRSGENPARWRGHLDHLLPERNRVQKVVHHPALAYDAVAGFMTKLRLQIGTAARGLEFQILTACRTGEIIGARWDEFDLDKKIWIIPGDRMKAGREHRVTLSSAALAIVAKMKSMRESDYVFPGQKEKTPLSNMAFLQLLKRIGNSNITAHGFRSTFRDWAAELTAYPSEVVEMALAHTVNDKVEAAYRRGDLLEKRRTLMEDWAIYCGSPAPKARKR